MTWEEVIIEIRKKPEYKDLVEKAYFEENLQINVERFKRSEEFAETLALIHKFANGNPLKLLDVGAGNGISSISFAQKGFEVKAVEPDKSETIGNGAILKLKDQLKLDNISVVEAYGEELPFPDNCFDVVYVRQAMHHAHNLDKFIRECSRLLKKGGLLFTVRDHVIFNAKDKKWFLKSHPLHKFYGGENAFTEKEYVEAMEKSGLEIKKIFRHFDSVINYFPLSKSDKEALPQKRKLELQIKFKKQLGPFANFPLIKQLGCYCIK